MHMKKLHALEEALACLLESQLTNLEQVDAAEMGEVVDMIKDIEEARYYCSAVKAMEDSTSSYFDFDGNPRMYYKGDHYPERRPHETYDKDEYREKEFPYAFQDGREGRSHRSRRMYMEAKETHQEKSVQMRELEKYMQELTQDVLEMVDDASVEEKTYLSKKIAALATKLQNLNG